METTEALVIDLTRSGERVPNSQIAIVSTRRLADWIVRSILRGGFWSVNSKKWYNPWTMEAHDDTPRFTRKGQATRERIVAAASALTFRNGVANTSTEDVRTSAGVSASQLYHYFASKRDLIRAVIAYQTQAVLTAQQPFLSRLDSFEALHAWRDHVIDLQKRRSFQGGCPLGTLSCELSEIWPEARADLAAGFGEWEAAIRRGLQAMRERGELRADADPERLALGTLAAVQGGLLLNQARRDTSALEAALDAMLAHIASFAT